MHDFLTIETVQTWLHLFLKRPYQWGACIEVEIPGPPPDYPLQASSPVRNEKLCEGMS
jgi:hypothetical protein